MWTTLSLLVTLAGWGFWFLVANAVPLAGISVVLALPAVVVVLAWTAHMGIDVWDDIKPVRGFEHLERGPINYEDAILSNPGTVLKAIDEMNAQRLQKRTTGTLMCSIGGNRYTRPSDCCQSVYTYNIHGIVFGLYLRSMI